MNRQAKRLSAFLLPVLSSASTLRYRKQQNIRCAGAASIEMQNARLEAPQVPKYSQTT